MGNYFLRGCDFCIGAPPNRTYGKQITHHWLRSSLSLIYSGKHFASLCRSAHSAPLQFPPLPTQGARETIWMAPRKGRSTIFLLQVRLHIAERQLASHAEFARSNVTTADLVAPFA